MTNNTNDLQIEVSISVEKKTMERMRDDGYGYLLALRQHLKHTQQRANYHASWSSKAKDSASRLFVHPPV